MINYPNEIFHHGVVKHVVDLVENIVVKADLDHDQTNDVFGLVVSIADVVILVRIEVEVYLDVFPTRDRDHGRVVLTGDVYDIVGVVVMIGERIINQGLAQLDIMDVAIVVVIAMQENTEVGVEIIGIVEIGIITEVRIDIAEITVEIVGLT